MKTFILALTILLLTTAFILWDAWYVCHTCKELLSLLTVLPDAQDNMNEFSASWLSMQHKWKKCSPYFRFLLGHETTDKIDDLIETTAIRYINGDISAYLSDRTLLKNAINAIREGEKIHISNIF